MRLGNFYWVAWIAEHPVRASFLITGIAILFFGVLPLLLLATPLRRVPLTYNLRNLQVRWKTTLVTALAFTMVTALLTVMLAFLTGMRKLTEGGGHPGNVLVLSDGATDEAFSNLPPFTIELLPGELQAMIQKDGKNHLAAQEVYVIVTHQIPSADPAVRKRRFVQLRGLDNPRVAGLVHEVALAHGDWPSAGGVRAITVTNPDGSTRADTAPEIVLGDGIARTLGADLGRASLMPGDVVEVGPRRWYVAGVMAGGSGSTFSSEIWTTDSFVQSNFGRTNSYSSYVVRTESAEIAKKAAVALKNFRSERNLQAFPEREYYAKLTQTNEQFGVAIYFVAVIMAAGGVLGIMNTMFAAISQRGKDIGVLRLMGYRRWQIFQTFQLESLLIALVGGLLGFCLGYLVDLFGLSATSIVSSGAGGGKSVVLRFIVDQGVLLNVAVFALLMGALGGVIPSLNAVRLRPLESLK